MTKHCDDPCVSLLGFQPRTELTQFKVSGGNKLSLSAFIHPDGVFSVMYCIFSCIWNESINVNGTPRDSRWAEYAMRTNNYRMYMHDITKILHHHHSSTNVMLPVRSLDNLETPQSSSVSLENHHQHLRQHLTTWRRPMDPKHRGPRFPRQSNHPARGKWFCQYGQVHCKGYADGSSILIAI